MISNWKFIKKIIHFMMSATSISWMKGSKVNPIYVVARGTICQMMSNLNSSWWKCYSTEFINVLKVVKCFCLPLAPLAVFMGWYITWYYVYADLCNINGNTSTWWNIKITCKSSWHKNSYFILQTASHKPALKIQLSLVSKIWPFSGFMITIAQY